jgi:hypothetical protein
MSAIVTTTIPVRNGEAFILQTLESLAAQTRRPDRVVVLDNCSTDSTPDVVRNFKGIAVEYIRNPKDLGVFGNFNRCLDFAAESDYLHILHADDLVLPDFYAVMIGYLEDCKGLGLAWCLDERIDEENRTLSVSGKADGAVEVLDRDVFLKRKAEIGNQAFAATLLKTTRKPVPCRFPLDMPILGDMVYWGLFGSHCDKLVHAHQVLSKYRWHGSNSTQDAAPSVQALVLDEWRTMETNEGLRGKGSMSLLRSLKLRGLMAVRSGIKAKRYRQQGNHTYSAQIVKAATQITGMPLWLAGQCLVELRDFIIFTILRRPRHPKNVFS